MLYQKDGVSAKVWCFDKTMCITTDCLSLFPFLKGVGSILISVPYYFGNPLTFGSISVVRLLKGKAKHC